MSSTRKNPMLLAVHIEALPPLILIRILRVRLPAVSVRIVTNSIDENAGLPMISAIVFYGIGNGVAAKTRQDSPKMFGPKTDES